MKTPKTAAWSASGLEPGIDGLTILGQLGQSVDGQIATATGQSKYINGQAGLLHLHRLRNWADVVVVGVGTLVADDPKLNVRLIAGKSPARLVIDPNARSPRDAVCLIDQSVRRVILTKPEAGTVDWPAGVEQQKFDGFLRDGRIDMDQFRAWMASQSWRRVLVEGGATTLAGFLAAGCLDYLHLITSPLMLGPGVAGIRGKHLARLADARRFKARSFGLGDDLLIECAFQ